MNAYLLISQSRRYLGRLAIVLPVVVAAWSTITISSAGGKDAHASTHPIVTEQNPFKFNLAPTYELGENSYGSVMNDFDGDGNQDFAVGNSSETQPVSISIVYGNSNGTFSQPNVFGSAIIPSVISSGDFNNDGRPDLVAAAGSQNRIAVYLNLGNRQFGAPFISAPPDSPPTGEYYDVEVGDFNGDGNLDVVALQDQVGKRLRFFNVGLQGQVTIFSTLNQPGSQEGNQGMIEVGEFNGDGRSDVVFSSGRSGARNISFVYGRQDSNLAVTFGFAVDDNPVGIDDRDLDNDGDKDLAVAFLDETTPTQHSIRTYRNTGTSSFPLQTRINIDYPFPPNQIVARDFDNDGLVDLATTISERGPILMVIPGRSGGTYGTAEYYSASLGQSIYAGDFNHDGKIDLCTASRLYAPRNLLSVVINAGSGKFKAPPTILWSPSLMTAGDFDNDGYLEIASAWRSEFNTPSSVDLLINDRRSGFLMPELNYPSGAALNVLAVADVNGDGNLDAVTGHTNNHRGLSAYLGNGQGVLGNPIFTASNKTFVKLTAGRFNSDSREDVIAVDESEMAHVYLSNGDGTFVEAPASPFQVGTLLRPVLTGDFTGDGISDLVDGTILLIGDGTGRFVRSMETNPDFTSAIGDFNGDGNLDLAGAINNRLYALLGDGHGHFPATFSRALPYWAESLVSADFDLDGRSDIAFVSEIDRDVGGNLAVVRSNGTDWSDPTFFIIGGVPISPGEYNGSRLVTQDFNSDGKMDLGYFGSKSRGVIYNTAGSSIATSNPDFDGDGKTDLSIFRPNGFSGAEWWWLRSSNGTNAAVQFGSATDRLAPFDFTGDGKTDVAFWRPSTGQWFVLRSEDFSFYAFPFGATGDVPVPADYDGDGKADAAVFRESSLTWYISKSSGGTDIVGFGAIGDKPVNADYDGDGKADIAVFRPNGANGAEWWVRRSSNSTVFATQFGSPTDKALPADYTGDGKADIAFWTPSSGNWFILRSEDLSYFAFPFGSSTDIPSPGDYDGDGKTDAAVFRPSNATWYANRSTAGLLIQQFGSTGDVPVPGAFVR